MTAAWMLWRGAQEAALAREVGVTTDPVEKMRLRVSLARFYEGQRVTAQAAQVMDALYRDNPAILGIVRATVDFYWRNKNSKRAIDVLEESAGRAEAGFRAEFTLEAARKSIESGDTARARAFATRLLSGQPYRAEYIAAMSDAYARAGDDRGLRTFFDAKIRELQNAPLAQTQRTEQVAAMRRALIPVLTRTKDFSAALDQYIEVLNRYPEDEGLAREAAAYASSNGVAAKLRDYYTKASNDSPKDFRWPMVLGRIETQLGDFPAAVAAYTRAAGVRPDRTDLLTSRLNLEERLLRFDEAAATANKLYELTYRNPQWMEKLAVIRAREGKNAEAVTALRKAWIDGRSANPQSYFDIAQKLEGWGALAEARRFSEQGVRRLTPENRDEFTAGVQMYARMLARLRAYDAAAPEVTAAGAPQIAAVVEQYYSPEEKLRYAAWVQLYVQAHPRAMGGIGLVQGAGMGDLEAKVALPAMADGAAGGAGHAGESAGAGSTSETTARVRGVGRAVGGLIRARAADANRAGRRAIWIEAAAAYRASGNRAAELRVLQLQNGRAALDGAAAGSLLPVADRAAAADASRRSAVRGVAMTSPMRW